MKKITLLLCLIACTAFGQQSYGDLANDVGIQANQSNTPAIITRVDNNRQPIIDTYSSLVDFDIAFAANCTGTLASEDFSGGPGGITDCGPIVSSAGDGCYAAGELEDGFSIEASNATNVVSIPPGAIGNVDALAGAITFAEYTIVNFSVDVYAVAMDLWENNDPSTVVRIYGAGDVLIDTFTVITPVNSQTFFGFISDEVVTKMEIEGENGSGELIGNFQFGGDCTQLSVDDYLLSRVSVYPNPASEVLNISAPSALEIKGAVLYDVLGKDTGVRLVNGTMNTSNLARGIYMLNLNTSAGKFIQKVVKQ